MDKACRPEFKITLGVSQEVSNDYLYGSRKGGSCGIQLVAKEGDFDLIDSAFKLIISLDPRVAKDALSDLDEDIRKRYGVNDVVIMSDYISGANERTMHAPNTRVSNIWTKARQGRI